SITAGTICNSTLMNNFVFHHPEDGSEPDNQITEFTVTKLTDGDNGTKSIGFYENAVIGPAEVWYDEDVNNAENEPVLATAENCYYLPTANEGDNDHNSCVLPEFNKLKCAEDSKVYVEGVNEEPRPQFLESCPIFLISTKRVPGVPAVKRDEHGEHLSYRLESEFSNHDKKGEFFGYYSYLWSDGNKLAEDIVWAEDGLSCTYTVYTSVENQKEDDIYALDGLGIPVQYDVCNLIHDRENKEIDIDDVTAERVKNEQGVDEFVIAWNINAKDYGELTGGELRCEILSTGEVLDPHTLTQEELDDGRAATPDSALPEGTQYKISAVLWDEKEDPGYKAEGETVYYEPYAILGDDIALEVNKLDTNGTLNLSGGETATLTLRATRSFSMKNGLKITAFANKDALEITSVVPGIVAFSGIAREGDTTVIEIAPAGMTKEKDYTDQYIFEDAVIATLTIGGKNVASEGEVFLHLQDFFGTDLKRKDGTVFSFAIDTKTTVVSSGGGGGDYTPPKKDTNTTQTLPDGTLVTTTTNSDGSIQIVYKRPDGVSATVKNPAKKGEASTASISLPPTLAGASVKVPIPVAEGGITTVAVLVGADGKEQVIPGSFWKDGVLTVPLTGNATILIRDNAKTFGDVAADHWAADAVAFVTSRELFNGGDKGFLPADDMTRSMLVTVLARYDGQDTATGARWDSVGTDWAKERGISDGSGMEDVITREQLAVMLFRYAKAEKAEGDLAGFSDAAGVSPWAQDAMGWAVKTGIISGADGALNPQGNASRAEVAAMLARFVTTA
ncbi:MAG: S-layer homology domain-containing protein, partial [Oscillospiraceae bacterium]